MAKEFESMDAKPQHNASDDCEKRSADVALDSSSASENQSGECTTSDSEQFHRNSNANDDNVEKSSPVRAAELLLHQHAVASEAGSIATTQPLSSGSELLGDGSEYFPPSCTKMSQPSTQLSQPSTQPVATCTHHQQTTTVSYTRNGHSRNPSSINGITIAAQQVAPSIPPNKPDAIDSLLKLIGFRGEIEDEKANSKQICGIREARLFMLFVLIIIFLISGTVFFVMWFTEFYNDSIVSSLVLAKNSTALKYFISPPINPQLRVHIFNYTNVDRFLKGVDQKLKVQDVGPYVYTEKAQKVNVVYNDNNTISYREHRTFDFRPDLSNGHHQFDAITVPNVPFLTAAWEITRSDSWKSFGIKGGLFTIGAKPFKTLPAHSFLWGYDDEIIDFSKTFSPNPPKFDKFGMLATRNGTSAESFTINAGVDDIRKLNVIDNFNGEPRMRFWSTNECNRVDGTDGSQFPPHLMDKKHPLQVFIKAFCRKFPMIYDSEVSLFNGVPAWRYKAPRNLFDNPKSNPENECYCDIGSGKCPPSGVFNATLCFDAPIYSSFPHFLYGDKKLFEKIEGLHPTEDQHLSYADVHPRLAFPMAGSSRFQINVQVHKSLSELGSFQNEQILPVMWMEVTSDEVPEELRAVIYHSTFSANAIQLSLRYGSLFGLAISMTLLVAGCYIKNSEENKETETITATTVTVDEFVTIDLNAAAKIRDGAANSAVKLELN